MNIGLPSGFLQFGTLAHRILLIMRDDGPQTCQSLKEALAPNDEFKDAPQAIAANIKRMRKGKFIWKIGNVRKIGERSCGVFYIKNIRPAEYQIRRLTQAERQAVYRHKMKGLRNNSVFTFRGKVVVNEVPRGPAVLGERAREHQSQERIWVAPTLDN